MKRTPRSMVRPGEGYLAAMRVHDRHLRERSEVMSVEKDLLALKQLTQASREACRTARHRYWAHVREHGC